MKTNGTDPAAFWLGGAVVVLAGTVFLATAVLSPFRRGQREAVCMIGHAILLV